MKVQHRFITVMASLVCLLAGLSGYAFSAPPDAGQILNEQRQVPAALPDRLPKDADKAVERPPLTDASVTVVVKGFTFSGNEGMATTAELEGQVRDAIGKGQTLADLRILADRITQYLRGKGFMVARAYLPRQDVSQGIIEIAILAGKTDGAVKIKVKEPKRIREARLRNIVEAAAPAGDTIKTGSLERAVLLIGDLPGLTARASLERGDVPGTTSVIIDAAEGPLFSGNITADNNGNRYTGEYRGGANLAVNDPFGIGDQLTLGVTGAESFGHGKAGYSLPLTASGLRANVGFNYVYYELKKDFASTQAEGTSMTASAGLSYPVVRTRNLSLWSELGYEYKALEDKAAGETIHDKTLHAGTLGFYGNTYDSFGGGALNTLRLSVGYGDLKFELAETDPAKTEGTYTKLNFGAARLQRLTDKLSLFTAVNGQYAFDNLDSSEKFILGGPSGVRAYPVGEASGDEGYLGTVEARFDLFSSLKFGNLQLVGFYDVGQIKLHHDPDFPGSTPNAESKNKYLLQGAGAGVNLGKPGLFSVRCAYAAKIGDNPGRSQIGDKDTDGRSDDGRFWINATLWF